MNSTDFILANVFGGIGLILWSIQLVPQSKRIPFHFTLTTNLNDTLVRLSWKRKTTQGLAPTGFILWFIATIALGIYLLLRNQAITLIVQAFLFGLLCATATSQYLIYDS